MGRVITAINRTMIVITVVIIIASIIMLYRINEIHTDMERNLAEINEMLTEIE